LASTYTDKNTEEELAQLKALLAEQQERLDALEGRDDAPADGNSGKEQRATRRQLLKLAGAAVAGAAGAAALRAIPAAAADGDPMTVGIVRLETLAKKSGVENTVAYPTANTAIYGYSFNAGYGVYAKSFYGTGLFAYAGYDGGGFYGDTRTKGTGIVALGGKDGIVATGGNNVGGGGTAVIGVGTGLLGTGVKAQTNSTSSRALYAYTSATSSLGAQIISTQYTGLNVSGGSIGTFSQAPQQGVVGFSYGGSNAGVLALSYGGPDIKLGGTGRLVQVANITGGVGAPNFTPAVGYFETVRAGDGAVWVNTGDAVATLKAAWKRLNAVRVDTADGAGAPFAPFRVYDSRSGAKKAPGSTTVVTIAPSGSGDSSIPSNAIAVIGNLTATQYTGTGFLSIAPAGVAVGTSAVNFITGQTAIANGFIVGLGTGVTNGGKLQVKVAGHSSHILIDITGYIQ